MLSETGSGRVCMGVIVCAYVREGHACAHVRMYVYVCREGFTRVYVKALRVYMSITSPCIATILDGMQAVPPDHPVTPVGRRALEYYSYLLASFLDRPTLLPKPFARMCALCVVLACMYSCARCVRVRFYIYLPIGTKLDMRVVCHAMCASRVYSCASCVYSCVRL